MRRTINAAALVALLLTAGLLSGCASSPSRKWATMTRVYTTTFDAVGDQYEAGRIDDEELLQIRRVRLPASAALDAVYESIITGDDAATESWLERTADLLDLAAAAIELAAESPAAPTAQE